MAIRRSYVTHSLAKQAFALKGKFPKAKVSLKPMLLVWTGTVQPTQGSRVYTVRMTYKHGRFPEVRVLSPALESRPGEALPHMYKGATLCLHQDGEWTPDMLIV